MSKLGRHPPESRRFCPARPDWQLVRQGLLPRRPEGGKGAFGEAVVAPDWADQTSRQQGDAEPSANAAENGLDDAKLKQAKSDDAALRQDRLQPQAVRAAGAKHDDLEISLVRQAFKRTHGPICQQHEFLTENRFLFEFRMVDRAADEGAFQPLFEHVMDEFACGACSKHQINCWLGCDINAEHR